MDEVKLNEISTILHDVFGYQVGSMMGSRVYYALSRQFDNFKHVPTTVHMVYAGLMFLNAANSYGEFEHYRRENAQEYWIRYKTYLELIKQ